jgi:hypothetical protein
MPESNRKEIDLILNLVNSSGPVSEALRQSYQQGRKLTVAELQQAFDQDNDLRRHLGLDQTDRTPTGDPQALNATQEANAKKAEEDRRLEELKRQQKP